MRFVALKSEASQSRAMLFRTRDLLVRQRTQTINALRGYLAEFGLVAATGPAHLKTLQAAVEDLEAALPAAVRGLARLYFEQIAALSTKIDALETAVRAAAAEDATARRLMTMPGVGPVTAMAVLGSVLGGLLSGRVPQESLRRAFGWFVLAMGALVLGQSLLAA